jgi:hypothetical protein
MYRNMRRMANHSYRYRVAWRSYASGEEIVAFEVVIPEPPKRRLKSDEIPIHYVNLVFECPEDNKVSIVILTSLIN